MGIKSYAKASVEKAGVPGIPGCKATDESQLLAEAEVIGYPLLLKADRGGGGKGIRQVSSKTELIAGLQGAAREAQSAFGNSDIIMEKCVHPARHIEVQIFRDNHGNAVHLFERDCSLQRRHQKIIEESPATGLTETTRQAMYTAALKIADQIGYTGAGTIEFLVDADENYYFMEVNTRLQVEHPVTEMITGIDLVEWQLRVAAGESLPLRQEHIHRTGHAIEMRVYAENPEKNFMPSTGLIAYFTPPHETENLRFDTGVTSGDIVTPHYDPILAKIISFGKDRPEAVRRGKEALNQCCIAGVSSNCSFLSRLLNSQLFTDGCYSNQALDSNIEKFISVQPPEDVLLLSAMALHNRRTNHAAATIAEPSSPWFCGDAFRLNHRETVELTLLVNEVSSTVKITPHNTFFHLDMNEKSFTVRLLSSSQEYFAIEIDGKKAECQTYFKEKTLYLFKAGSTYCCSIHDVTDDISEGIGAEADFFSPMPGRITSLPVKEGEKIEKGTTLMTLEAMKMEHSIIAPCDGQVTEFLYNEGQTVEEGVELLHFEKLP